MESMGYVDHNLITGESVTYRGKLHGILFVKPGLISLMIFAVIVLLLYALNLNQVVSTETAVLAGLAGFIVSVVPLFLAFLTWKAAEFSVTNKRVILKVEFTQSRT